MRGKTLWAVILTLALGGCATQEPIVRDGQAYGVTEGTFRGRWWSYYERGVSYLEGSFYAEAEADFQTALIGRSRDTWHARTYGLHFTEYFPNRELGVVYYYRDELDKAEEYLRRSLDHVDTARAHHYLDRILSHHIAQGRVSDREPPSLIAAIDDRLVSASRDVGFTLEARDDVAVSAVSFDGRLLPQRRSSSQVSFQKQLLLNEGHHTFEMEATDLAGQTARKTVDVTVDLTGPIIGILDPAPGTVTEDGEAWLHGIARDDSGITSVDLDGRPLAIVENRLGEAAFETVLPLDAGANTFVITARDEAGNETATSVTVFRGEPGSIEARLWRLERRGGVTMAALGGAPVTPALLSALESATEETPRIQMRFPHDRVDRDAYRKQEIRLAGLVEAEEGLAEFRILHDEYPVIPGARQIEFSRRIPIEHGENTLEVAVTDAQGRTGLWSTVIQGAPVMLQEYRMRVVIQPAESAMPDLARELEAYLSTDLATIGQNRFSVVERAALADILQEHELTALADPRTAVRLGQLELADLFVYSTVAPVGTSGIEILTRAISTETGNIVDSFDVYIADWTDARERARQLNAVAAWLARAFPRESGAVTQVVPGRGIWIDLGEAEGIKQGMRVVLVEELVPAERDPVTGAILEEAIYDAAGLAPVVGVESRENRSRLGDPVSPREREEPVHVEEGQPVFTL